MRLSRSRAAGATALVSALVSVAHCEEAAPKPALPSIADLLEASGITVTGYVDGTFAAERDDTNRKTYNTFALQQAAFTLSVLPKAGFGALVNVIAGQSPYAATGFASTPAGVGATSANFYVLQGFVQYATGSWLLQGGKFPTLAGAEVVAPPNNSNITRSILFAYEPVTHTGVRATYAASDTLNLIVGLNNGWTNSPDTGDGSDETLEAGLAFTPSKTVMLTLQGYYGRAPSAYVSGQGGSIPANMGLLDTVLTWCVTSTVTLVGSVDYGNAKGTSVSSSASWYGAAGYVNYALNGLWRASLRGEYFNDENGYLTKNFAASFDGKSQKLKEITLTLGFDPIKNVEIRLEGRYDDPSKIDGSQLVSKTYQGWLEVYYKS